MSDDYKMPGRGASFDSGIGLFLLRAFLFFTLAVFVLGGYAFSQFNGLRSSESMEVSHLAHNLASGEGYTTRSITPFDIWFLDKHGVEVNQGSIPDIHHAPGYPMLLSVVYRVVRPAYEASRDYGIFDAEYKAVVPLGILLTLLCAIVLFVFGRSVFGLRIAGLATTIYLISNLTLSSMISGGSLPLLSLSVTLVCGLAIRVVQLSATREHVVKLLLAVFGCAVFTAIALLTDYTMIAVALAVLVLFALQLQHLRWTSLLIFVVLTGLLVSPWLMHNHKLGIGVIGAKPYTAVSGSSLYKENTMAQTVEPEFNSYRVGSAIKRKIATSVAEGISGRKAMAGGIVVCFFVLAIFHRHEKREINALKWMVLGILGGLVLITPLIGPSYLVVGAIFPVVVLLGVCAFTDYLDREEYFEHGMQQLLMWAMIVASALPAVAQVITGGGHSYPPYYAPIQGFVCSMIEEEETLYTDIPWATAWYGSQTSFLIPEDINDVSKITTGWDKVGGVYLTSETANMPASVDSSWRKLWQQKVPEEIPLRHSIAIPTGRSDQLFLSDRPRW